MKSRLIQALPLLFLLLTSCERGQQSSSGSQAGTGIETLEMTPNGGVRTHSSTITPVKVNPKFAAVLAKVEAQGITDYPDIVTPLPEKQDFESFTTGDLVVMLESWNSALRTQAANALSSRGNEAMPFLVEGIKSDNWRVRAGCTAAFRAIFKAELKVCNSIKEPGARGDAKKALEEKYADAINHLITLAADERVEVRRAALEAILSCAPRTDDFRRALMKLWVDPDEMLAQYAKGEAYKHFGLGTVPPSEFIPVIKAAMNCEMPNGRGVMVREIARMKPELQREFIPDLLAHLDWNPRRDTMFAGSGQQEAVRILTAFKEPQLIERIPMVLYKNRAFAFDACVEAARAFGKDAVGTLPTLKAIYADCIDRKPTTNAFPHLHKWDESMKKLKETIEYLESL